MFLQTMTICIWMVLAFPFGGHAAQIGKHSPVLFENKDFKIVSLGDLSDTKQPISGLLMLPGQAGRVETGSDLWKLPGPHGESKDYYWADSASAGNFTGIIGENPGLLLIPKSSEKVNGHLFAPEWPDSFKESVGHDINSIASLIDDQESGKPASRTDQDRARAGLEDLLFKSRWVLTNGPSGNPFVDVTARTLDQSGVIVQHCTVWYVPVDWEHDKQHWKRFDQFSSPTTQSILVGQYKMWANHNGKDGTKVPVSPGDDQKPTKNVDLEVP